MLFKMRNFMYCTMQPQTVYIIAFMLWPPSAALPVNDFSSSFIWTLKKEIFFVFFCVGPFFSFSLWKKKNLSGCCGIACIMKHFDL